MKRSLILLLVIALTILSVGCDRTPAPPKQPVTFYYPVSNPVYDGKTGLIHSEVRDSTGLNDNMTELINLYLRGPLSETLRSPFPENVTVTRYSTTANTVILELSSEFANLSGIDLTLACACMAHTLLDMTGLERFQISAADSMLDGMSTITMERNDLYMTDTPNLETNNSKSTAE